MERRINKRLVAILLSFAMILSMLPIFSVTGHAAAANGDAIIAFTSDVHNEPTGEAATRLGSWIDGVNEHVGGTGIDFMAFCGDMGKASTEPASGTVTGDYWQWTQQAIDKAVEKLGEDHVAFTTGNHELNSDDGGYNANTTYTSGTQSWFDIDKPVTQKETYEIYCMGSTSSDQVGGGYSPGQIDKLKTYLNGISENSKKIYFIATHYPLHYCRSGNRYTKNADSVIETINNAVANKKIRVVFIWGHTHSQSDPLYKEVHYPEDTLTYNDSGKTAKINFFYVPAGCMSDSENSTGNGANIPRKGLVCRITSNFKGFFSYYDKNGNLIDDEISMSTLNSVTYDANGATEGTVPVDVNEYESDAEVTVLGNTGQLKRTGYDFGGWSDGTTTYNADATFKITSNVKLSAVWVPHKYTVVFLPGADDVTGTMNPQQFEYDKPQALTANAYTRSGWSFKCWVDKSGRRYYYGDEYENLSEEDGGIVELTATWNSNSTPVSGVTLDKSTLNLEVGASQKLKATVTPKDAIQTVSWASADSSIAKVAKDGTVTAVKAGKTSITVTTDDGGKTAKCTVTVTEKASSSDSSSDSNSGKTVKEVKDTAKTQIEGARSQSKLASYKEDQQIQIINLVADYKKKLEQATTKAQVDKLMAEFNSALKAIPTAAAINKANNDTTKKISSTGITLKSVKAGKKKLTVKWTPKSSVFAGYQISYRIKGKKWKTVNVAGAKKSSKVIKKLKKGKKYQVKVRGYKKVGNKTVYGKYSKTKAKKVK